MKKQDKTAGVHFYVAPEFKKLLRVTAAKHDMSMSSYIVMALEKQVAADEKNE